MYKFTFRVNAVIGGAVARMSFVATSMFGVIMNLERYPDPEIPLAETS